MSIAHESSEPSSDDTPTPRAVRVDVEREPNDDSALAREAPGVARASPQTAFTPRENKDQGPRSRPSRSENSSDAGATREQVAALRALTVILLVGLGIICGLVWHARLAAQPVTILVNGSPVTTVTNMAAAIRLVTQAQDSLSSASYPPGSVVRMQKVQYRASASDVPLDSDDTARAALTSHMTVRIRAYVIKINGVASIGLPTSQVAIQALALVKAHFAQMPPAAPLVGEPTIAENVVIDRQPVAPNRALTAAEDAASYFWTPPPAKIYTVQLGDTGYAIARAHHISFSDFLVANAGHDMNKIKPGDIVNVEQTHPALTVLVKKRIAATEPIVKGVAPENAGLRRIVYAVTYANGAETRRDVLSMTTLQRPHVLLRL